MSLNMDVKQLQDAGRHLLKAHEAGDPGTNVLALLGPLEKWKATEDLLRQSKIGVAVNKLRQNKDPQVAQLSSQLVNRWKADVKKKPQSPAPGAKGAGANGASSASPAPAVKKEAAAAPKKSSVAPEKRNAKEDGVNTAATGSAVRDGCLQLIYNGLAFMSQEAPDEILAAAKKVENAALDAYGPETSTEYKQKMRSLHLNLKMKQNSGLRKDVFSGKIEAKRFVRMTSDELKSDDKRKQDEALEKENMNKAMTAQEEKAISTTMTCGKCRQSAVSYSQAQTRSADEPMTTFCECTICGNRWKFS